MAKSEKNQPEAMDPSVTEESNPGISTHRKRVAYAVATLAAEVGSLFPETTAVYGGEDGRGVALHVTFDTSESPRLSDLLSLIKSDIRIKDITYDEREAVVLVEFWGSARVQDLRDPFNLADAWSVLTECEEPEGMSAGYEGGDAFSGLASPGDSLDGGGVVPDDDLDDFGPVDAGSAAGTDPK